MSDQRERSSGEKEKERRGQRPKKLGSFQKAGVAGIAAEPGIITVRLEHEDAGEAAHPVDPGETRRWGRSHGRGGNGWDRAGPRRKATAGHTRPSIATP